MLTEEALRKGFQKVLRRQACTLSEMVLFCLCLVHIKMLLLICGSVFGTSVSKNGLVNFAELVRNIAVRIRAQVVI